MLKFQPSLRNSMAKYIFIHSHICYMDGQNLEEDLAGGKKCRQC